MRRVAVVLVLLSPALSTASSPGPAPSASTAPSASPSALDLARAAYVQGVKLYEEGDFHGALDKFAEALAVKDTPQIRFNMARCLERLGRLVAATRELQTARADAKAAGNAKLEKSLEDYLALLEPRLGHLVLSVTPATATLKLDSVGVVPGSHALDPGKHVVVATDGKKSATTAVTLKEGETKKLALVVQ